MLPCWMRACCGLTQPTKVMPFTASRRPEWQSVSSWDIKVRTLVSCISRLKNWIKEKNNKNFWYITNTFKHMYHLSTSIRNKKTNNEKLWKIDRNLLQPYLFSSFLELCWGFSFKFSSASSALTSALKNNYILAMIWEYI